jgi:hypothetical protein
MTGAPHQGETGVVMGFPGAWDSGPSERRLAAVERVQAARSRAAAVLVVSAGLAQRHAERAEANGDLERAHYERAVARRVWASVERLRE